MESLSYKVLDDHSSEEGSLLLESLSCNPVLVHREEEPCCPLRPSRASNGETKNVEHQGTTERTYSPTCLPLRVYFSMLAMELNTDVENLVIVVDNAHIPLGDEYLLENEDLRNEAFSRSLSDINTVSFPPPFLKIVKNEDRDVFSSRWDSIQVPRGTRRRSGRPQLVNQTQSTDSGPQMPGRTCDDYEETEEEAQSIDMTMHQRFMERNLQSPVPIKKTRPRRGGGRRRRGPIIPPRTGANTPTSPVERRKPYRAPGPSSSLDSTSRWLRELPHRGGDMNPMPPCASGLLVDCRGGRCPTTRRGGCGDSVEDLDSIISVTKGERRKEQVPVKEQPDSTTSEKSSWTAWFDMMSSMTSAQHYPGSRDIMNPIGVDVGMTSETKETVLHQEKTTFQWFDEASVDPKPNDSGHHGARSWDELTSMQRSSFWRSRRANPSSLVNQLMIIDNGGSPTNPFQRATQSPASHFKREQTKRKGTIDLLLGHVSSSNAFERDTGSLSVSSHS